MEKFRLLILLIFSFFSLELIACSCGGPGTFCETVSNVNWIDNPLVVKGIISKKEDNGVEVTIHDVISGDFLEDKVFITSGGGGLCSHSTDFISKDETYIFVLGEYENVYSISICHVSYLKIENGNMVGPIAPGLESHPYKDLHSLESCAEGLKLFPIKNSLSFFPNPTLDEVRIKNIKNYDSNGFLELEMIDVLGHKLRFYKKEEGLQSGEEWIINISEWAAGVYFFRVISSNQKEVFRIVKQ